MGDDVEALVEELIRGGFSRVETHISWVLLGEREVYKIKKPVSLGFLDFGSLEERRRFCEAEVRLNRRLAPEVYLGVVPITRDEEGRHRIGGEGEPIEWAVHMRRLADEDRADLRLEEGRLSASQIEDLASHLVRFHAEARGDEETASFGTPAMIEANVRENFEQTRGTVGRYVDTDEAKEIEAKQLEFLDRNRGLFESRARAGRVRDGHGDLRLEHVYFDGDAILVIDCIEFNDRFRYADVCADLAFLGMDLVYRERTDLAELLLARYARDSGDYDLYALVDFYESYRAYVRGKVSSFIEADTRAPHATRRRAAAEARRYFRCALALEREPLAPPCVMVVGGLIASGKSTLATALGRELWAPVVESDRTRKQLSGIGALEPLKEPAFSGAYSPEATERVYAEIGRRAERVLDSGRSVIVDATFASGRRRADLKKLAADRDLPFLFVECRVSAVVARARLEERARGATVSDGRLEIYDDFVASWEPVEEIAESERMVVDTSLPIEETVSQVMARRDL